MKFDTKHEILGIIFNSDAVGKNSIKNIVMRKDHFIHLKTLSPSELNTLKSTPSTLAFYFQIDFIYSMLITYISQNLAELFRDSS